VSTMLDMTPNAMAMPMCDTTVAPYARPRSSWLRAVSPMATGLGHVVTLPSFAGVKTDQGTEINAKDHGARRPPETST
jgi:hypothetical protein